MWYNELIYQNLLKNIIYDEHRLIWSTQKFETNVNLVPSKNLKMVLTIKKIEKI